MTRNLNETTGRVGLIAPGPLFSSLDPGNLFLFFFSVKNAGKDDGHGIRAIVQSQL